jgi:uncharacterized membrane protein
MGMPVLEALVLGVLGSLLPVPLVLILLDPVMRAIRKAVPFQRFYRWFDSKNRSRAMELRKYGPLGLCLFVAIPFPSTGAWSGAILASFLGIKFWIALAAISAGTLISGIIMTLLTLAGSGLVLP